MSETVIEVDGVSKLYRLGEVGTGSLAHDVNRWWHRLRGKEDPYSQVGQVNDRTKKAESDWVWALKDINFSVKQGEVLGIIGHNGAGKSTLLKILSRVTGPSHGEVRVKGRIASLLEVGTGFHPELTGRENIFLNGAILGMTRREIRGKLDEIVGFSGCEAYLDTPVKRYSSGMQVRLAFAVAAHLDPEILIVDEVLAVGDVEFQNKCVGKLKNEAIQGKTVLFVSHNLAAVNALCQTGILMSCGTIIDQGGVSKITDQYIAVSAIASRMKFNVCEDKPCITGVEVDEAAAKRGDLLIETHFKSPHELKPPIVGIVVYSNSGVPVFGSNPRFHQTADTLKAMSSGTALLRAEGLQLAPGRYSVSVWLGDWHSDFDCKEGAVSFEFRASEGSQHRPNPLVVGYIDCSTNWTLRPVA
jgi:lipopolysaccharide transport system ATP-binding protein